MELLQYIPASYLGGPGIDSHSREWLSPFDIYSGFPQSLQSIQMKSNWNKLQLLLYLVCIVEFPSRHISNTA
jgi:hypothetical protein